VALMNCGHSSNAGRIDDREFKGPGGEIRAEREKVTSLALQKELPVERTKDGIGWSLRSWRRATSCDSISAGPGHWRFRGGLRTSFDSRTRPSSLPPRTSPCRLMPKALIAAVPDVVSFAPPSVRLGPGPGLQDEFLQYGVA